MTITQAIKKKLENHLNPLYLKLIDNSDQHFGHAGHTGRNETHFSLTIVSKKFEGLTMLKQHKMVYEILADEIKKIHAFTLKTLKPSQTK